MKFDNLVLESEQKVFVAEKFFDENLNTIIRQRGENNDGQKRHKAYTASVFFCPKCKKMHFLYINEVKNSKHIYNSEQEGDPEFLEMVDVNGRRNSYDHEAEFECPSCGFIFSKEDLHYLPRRLDTESMTLKSVKIFPVKDDKLVASVFSAMYFPSVETEQLAVVPVRYRIVFNLKTGQTFLMEGRTLSNKHPKFDDAPHVFRATFFNKDMAPSAYRKITSNPNIVAVLAEAILEVYGGQKEQLTKKGDFSDTTFNMITCYNYAHYFNFEYYKQASEIINTRHYDRASKDRIAYKFNCIKTKFESNDPELFSKYLFKGIKNNLRPKKAIKKIIFQNPLLSDLYRFMLSIGFSNQDVLLSFMTSHLDCSKALEKLINTVREEEDHEICIQFLSFLLEVKGEAETLKYLSSSKDKLSDYFVDTAYMAVSFHKRDMLKNRHLKGSLKQTHDALARDFYRIKNPNRSIDYNEEEMALNDNIDDIDFILAKDTYELIDIGQEMGICVGSYGNKAANKQSVILKMIQGKKYVGCIELTADCKEMIQAKACYNNLLQEVKAEALKKWVKKHKIQANCSDYRHIKNGQIEYNEDQIYQGHYNYANYYLGNVRYQARQILHEGEETHDDDDGLDMLF